MKEGLAIVEETALEWRAQKRVDARPKQFARLLVTSR